MTTIAPRGQYRPHAHARGCTLASVSFDTNNTSHPDGLSDPGGIVDSVERGDTGTIVVKLKRRYAAIHATASIGGTAGNKATVSGVTTGIAAQNSVTVTTYAATGSTAADTTDLKVHLILALYDHADTD